MNSDDLFQNISKIYIKNTLYYAVFYLNIMKFAFIIITSSIIFCIMFVKNQKTGRLLHHLIICLYVVF